MKKFLAVFLAMVMMISASVMAFADGGFISSPSGNAAPVVVEVVYDENSCEARIVVTPYADRDELSEDKKEEIDGAYDEISENENLVDLCAPLAGVAESLGVDSLHLAVSDLFDISCYHEGDHDYCGTITITLSSETINHFVALLHRNEGSWEVVSNVTVDRDACTISFSLEKFSPFAIVVDSSAIVPDTGDNIYILAGIMFVAAVSLVAVLVNLKKKKSEA